MTSKMDPAHIWVFRKCLNQTSLNEGWSSVPKNLYMCERCETGIIGSDLEQAITKATELLPPFECFDLMVGVVHGT